VSTWGLGVFPLLASGVAAAFGWMLLARYLARRRPAEASWTVAMFMFAVASFAMFLGVVWGWTPTEYRLYWLFGAILNVPYLFLGEAYLLARRRTAVHVLGVAVLLASVYAAVVVFRAPIVADGLEAHLPLGKDAFAPGSAAYRLAQLYAFPAYFLLLFGLVWSSWQMRGRPELRNRTVGTLGIAAGATIVAIASGVGAGYDVVPLFSVGLAAGVSVMFWGFLQAVKPSPPVVAPA